MRESESYNVNGKALEALSPIAGRIVKTYGLNQLRTKIFTIQPGENHESARTSYLGTPVFSNLVFPAGSYTITQGGQSRTVDFDGLTVDTVLMEISQRKNIVKTEIQGRPGTVKEYVSLGDYQIQIRGILASERQSAIPEEDLKKLRAIMEVPEAVRVESAFLELFEIDTIVIESWRVNQETGFVNNIPFEMSASSDQDLILEASDTVEL